ncbi:MAG: outer membrane protein assembly factor BamA, partial [Deltaproteobacteria bacterium]
GFTASDFAVGGNKEIILNAEYIFHIIRPAKIKGVFFFDMGNVYEKDESYSFSGIKRSVGLGIRWYSPIGPLRLEYGKVLSRKKGEPSGNWEFSIGGIF